MAWEENSRICINMQLIAILSRTGVIIGCFIRSNGVVEIELADSVLLVKRTDTLQITFHELSRIKD